MNDRYTLGYCPSCQELSESEVGERFTVLEEFPASKINEIALWSLYGSGAADANTKGWEFYWPWLEAWPAAAPPS